MINHFRDFVKTISAALPKVYGVQPVIEAMASATGLDPNYTGDRHLLLDDLIGVVNAAHDAQEDAAKERLHQIANLCHAQRQFLLTQMLHTIGELQLLCSNGGFGGDGAQESELLDLTQDVWNHIHNHKMIEQLNIKS